jgi:hypothetical protein
MHLMSLHRYPTLASLGVDQAYRYLLDAPSIVKQMAPMSWTYMTAPADGTMWLEWIPLEKNDQPFPSDGYAWIDPEQTYRHELNGYTVEMRVHTIGFRPGQDQVASHARTRYHLVAKNPSINAPPPDPALWLVHYHHADRMLPAAQLPIPPQVQNMLAQRRWLESLGRLERVDFMLHDRNNWPTVNLPGTSQTQQPGAYGANTMAAMQMNQNRYPQAHYPQQSGNPREAKKPRLEGPPRAGSGGIEALPDVSIEIEEDTSLGDFFDHLTQRDISVARYMQHQRWMEEVFSSPYSSHSIVPADLGLGLMGELKGLTDGILEPPSQDFVDRPDTKPLQAKEAAPFTNLKKEQVEEFGKRVEKHLEEGRAEVERMKAEHAARMQDWKKVKTLTQAEKRLKYAALKGSEEEVAVFRLEEPATNGQTEAGSKENVDDVVKDVESILRVKIAAHDDATRIARGGLKDRKEPAYDYAQQQDTTMDSVDTSQHQPGITSNGATGEATTYHEDPMANSQNATISQPHSNAPSQPQQDQSQQQQPAMSGLQSQQNGDSGANNDVLGDLPELDMNDDTLMQDMVMDVDDSNLEFDESALGLVEDDTTDAAAPAESAAAPSQPIAAESTTQSATAQPATETQAATSAPAAESVTAANAAQDSAAQPPTAQPQAETNTNAPADDNTTALTGEDGGDSMFTDTFGDLANLEGDEILDFDAGMDDSAFGEALHGMGDDA